MPEVSIITPLYNGAGTIAECLASVAAQSHADYEHLVIDNRSDDEGPQLVGDSAEKDSRIRLLSCPHRQGAAAARNVGIEAAKGRYIAFLDADDRFHPDKLSIHLAAMQNRELGLGWTSYQLLRNEAPLRVQHAVTSATAQDILMKKAVIGCSSVMLRRDVLGGLRFDENLSLHEDFVLWVRLAEVCTAGGVAIGGLDEVLTEYSVGGGVSANKIYAAAGQWAALRRGLGLSRPRAIRAMAAYFHQTLSVRLA